ncbi:kinesin light chain-like [Pocillopora damicornis]|uniref:kinesin light chain-like n=1 Tax=Pocillopora damicornis TaxID=46731 RepID=UPI000F54F462|nr:kinesin light chain-like [Pocillopora damicornis]
MALQPFRDEQLNYFKFASIVLDEFPKALRQTFTSMWDNTLTHLPGHQPWDDSAAIRNKFLTLEGGPGRTKVPTNLSYEEWDCTALFQATIHAKSFALPDSGGHHKTLGELFVKPRKLAHGVFHASVTSPSGNNAETVALAIDQVRLLRNSLFHSHTSEITKATFDQYVKHAKDAFEALGVKTDPIDVIGGLTESEFPTNKVRKLEECIKEENRAFVSFLQQQNQHLEGISSDVKALKHKMEVMPTKDDIFKMLEQIFKDLIQAPAQNKPDKNLTSIKPTKDTSLDTHTADQDRKQEEVPCLSHGLLKVEYETAVTHLKSDDFVSALESAKRALDITRTLFGEEHPKMANNHLLVGLIQIDLGNYASAFQSCQSALDIRRKHLGEEHPDTAKSYFSLGVTQNSLAEYAAALQSFQRALDIRRKLFSEQHQDTALSYHSLAVTQYSLGDYVSALQSDQCALDIRRKLFGEEHSDTANSYDSLGTTQHSLSDYESAQKSKRSALDIRRKLFGEEHSDTANSYSSLGATQHSLGDYKSAQKSKQRALDIRRKLFGEEHQDTAESYSSIGKTQKKLGELTLALQSKQRSLDIRRKWLGEEHLDTAESYYSLGVIQHSLRYYASAQESKQRALNIMRKLFGEEHSDTAKIYDSLGATQHSIGDCASAQKSKQRALDIRRKLFGEDHPDTDRSYSSIRKTQTKFRKQTLACQSKRRSLKVGDKIKRNSEQ